jgi:hypothetical protein
MGARQDVFDALERLHLLEVALELKPTALAAITALDRLLEKR